MTDARRIPMQLDVAPQGILERRPYRTLRRSDRENLAILLYAAFRGTIDDEGETFADALGEIDRTLSGGYGPLLDDCSLILEQGEFLASACLMAHPEPDPPLVVFSMTRPEAQRRGLARFLLRSAIDRLHQRGHTTLTLVVTEGNTPAQKLYRSLGFRPIPR